jgi:hypothetical protein
MVFHSYISLGLRRWFSQLSIQHYEQVYWASNMFSFYGEEICSFGLSFDSMTRWNGSDGVIWDCQDLGGL